MENFNEYQRAYRKANGNANTKRYEKTRKGKIMRSYRNMQSRVEGVTHLKNHLYLGKDIMSRDDFYEWSLSDEYFNVLFDTWVYSDYDRRLSPSVDRIDSTKGYIAGNVRWLTHSENSRLGAMNKPKKATT